MPSGLHLSVVSDFIGQMVTGGTEISKEYDLFVFQETDVQHDKTLDNITVPVTKSLMKNNHFKVNNFSILLSCFRRKEKKRQEKKRKKESK